MEGKRVSMRQIARECDCSVATVSYALNPLRPGKTQQCHPSAHY